MVSFKCYLDGTMRTLGIILAGGKSTRLYPSTLVATKQLLPVYDKPLIYYPLSTLMLAGVRDFIIISSPGELDSFNKLFANAKEELGISVRCLVQPVPLGIADAFNIVHNTIQNEIFEYDAHALILGDNIFYGSGLRGLLDEVNKEGIRKKAEVFLYPVRDPELFGVAEVMNNKVISIEEKPTKPKSNLAVTGLYFYPTSVYLYTTMLSPSKRGELEITDLNKYYLDRGEMEAVQLSRGMVWFDTGNAEAMLEAANFIHNVQKHQNYLVGSPHEIAITKKWVTREGVTPFIELCSKTEYGKYLKTVLDREEL
jgi:glucose-1-phosphate thymidylyltransferase